MSTTTELAELHELIGGLRRCVTSLASSYGDTPAMRRIVNDAERILNDIDRLDIDAEELELSRGVTRHHHRGEKIAIPDTQYDTRLLGRRRRRGRRRLSAAADLSSAALREHTPKGNTVSAPTADRQATGVFSPTPCPDPAAHAAHRPLVEVAADRRPGLRRVRHLRDGAGVPAEQLLRRRVPLPDAVLLAVHQHGLCAGGQPLLAADPARRVVASVRGVDAAVPAAVPADLLLLPRRLLPLGVAVPDRVRGGRTAREIHWRDPVPADHPEHAPVLLLHRRRSSR